LLRTSEMLTSRLMSASSSGVLKLPRTALATSDPTLFAALPFASGDPIVRSLDACTGGLQDGEFRGVPWVELGDVHGTKAGTSAVLNGVAPFGRG
jgi:hypothetical protein